MTTAAPSRTGRVATSVAGRTGDVTTAAPTRATTIAGGRRGDATTAAPSRTGRVATSVAGRTGDATTVAGRGQGTTPGRTTTPAPASVTFTFSCVKPKDEVATTLESIFRAEFKDDFVSLQVFVNSGSTRGRQLNEVVEYLVIVIIKGTPNALSSFVAQGLEESLKKSGLCVPDTPCTIKLATTTTAEPATTAAGRKGDATTAAPSRTGRVATSVAGRRGDTTTAAPARATTTAAGRRGDVTTAAPSRTGRGQGTTPGRLSLIHI